MLHLHQEKPASLLLLRPDALRIRPSSAARSTLAWWIDRASSARVPLALAPASYGHVCTLTVALRTEPGLWYSCPSAFVSSHASCRQSRRGCPHARRRRRRAQRAALSATCPACVRVRSAFGWAGIELLICHSGWQSSVRNEEGVGVANEYPIAGYTFVTLAVSRRECVFSSPFAVARLDCYF